MKYNKKPDLKQGLASLSFVFLVNLNILSATKADINNMLAAFMPKSGAAATSLAGIPTAQQLNDMIMAQLKLMMPSLTPAPTVIPSATPVPTKTLPTPTVALPTAAPTKAPSPTLPPPTPTLAIILTSVPTATPTTVPATSMEQETVNLLNQERSKNGLPALKLNDRLNQASLYHSNYMKANNCFSHQCAGEANFCDRMKAYGYNGCRAENIAAGQLTAQEVVTAWMNSPGHRSNILGDYGNNGEIGIGKVDCSSGCTYKTYWTTDFGSGQ